MSQPEPIAAPAPGSQYLAEIREQPAALRRLLEHRAEYARVAPRPRAAATGLVRMVGHGSSDNAASFGVYAFGLLPGLTAMRDSISLTVYYDAKLDLSGSTVIALSQSGQDARRARVRGAGAARRRLHDRVTNEPESDLAQAAEAVLPLAAGAELAVAATKTYSNQLAALGAPRRAASPAAATSSPGCSRTVAEQLEEHLPVFERARLVDRGPVRVDRRGCS